MKKFSVILLLACAACTQHPKVGGSLPPATFINVASTSKVTDKLAELCSRRGLIIDETTNKSVTCSASTNSFVQIFMGTKGGSEVRTKIRMNAFKVKDQVKVVASGWYESQNFYGRMDRTQANDSNANTQIQSLLDEAKLELDGKVRK